MTQDQNSPPKEMIVLLNHAARVMVLVPKKHQDGYLKVPAGHKRTPLIDFITDELGCDVFGLEGHLSLDVPARFKTEASLIDEFVKPLADYLGYSFKIVGVDEFFDLQKANYKAPRP